MIPEKRRDAVLKKYYEETLSFADSLRSVNSTILDQHHTETGILSLYVDNRIIQ